MKDQQDSCKWVQKEICFFEAWTQFWLFWGLVNSMGFVRVKYVMKFSLKASNIVLFLQAHNLDRKSVV